MTTPNDAGRDFGTSDCSSAFTYDEIVALVKRKKAFWLKRLHQVDSDSCDDFIALSAYVAACDFIVQDIAVLSMDKQKRRMASNG
jgi:hypothetical protein